jgi:NADH:ubiquinone oxidoreductase subunit 2 (subunit N)
MFDNHVRWYLSASWILLVLLAFLGTNAAVFTRNVTLLVASILIVPLILFALLTLARQPQRRLQPVQARFDADARDLMRMDSDKG